MAAIQTGAQSAKHLIPRLSRENLPVTMIVSFGIPLVRVVGATAQALCSLSAAAKRGGGWFYVE